MPLIPIGNHHAICYGVVDIGTQSGGKFDPARKILVLWEFPHVRAKFKRDDKEVDLPRATSKEYTLSLGKKANLRHDLELWRAKPFDEKELAAFDVSKLIGANCLISMIHQQGKGTNSDKTFSNVKGVSSLPTNMQRIKTIENKALYFSFEEQVPGVIEFPDNMPDWIKKKIEESEEFKKGGMIPPAKPEATQVQTPEQEENKPPF